MSMGKFRLTNNQTGSEHDFRDLGFGTRIGANNERLVNQDGSFNVRRNGGGLGAIHPYQFLITIRWWQFWVLVLLFYLTLNSLFALFYMWAGVENLSGAPTSGGLAAFAHAFYFSVQTFTTVGYGSISPVGHTTSLISSFEAMLGLMGFAIATGVLYGRFAKPSAKIRFSRMALIAPYQGISSFQVRIVNRRKNQLIEVTAEIFMVRYETIKGEKIQRYYKLPLERDRITLFPLNWTLVHPIDPHSPIYGKTYEDLLHSNTEFLVMVKGFDDTFAQEVHARSSYKTHELVWGGRFLPTYYTNEQGLTVLEIDKIDDFEEVRIPGLPDATQDR